MGVPVVPVGWVEQPVLHSFSEGGSETHQMEATEKIGRARGRFLTCSLFLNDIIWL
jgi:hypothetical protein